jgi:large subunit ribosomal protein L21
MSKVAVIKTGGKQYLAKEQEILVVDKLAFEKDQEVELGAVAVFDTEGDVEIGMPLVAQKIKVKVVDQVMGDKVRIARFKAKARYRKVTGFRPKYTKIQVVSI